MGYRLMQKIANGGKFLWVLSTPVVLRPQSTHVVDAYDN